MIRNTYIKIICLMFFSSMIYSEGIHGMRLFHGIKLCGKRKTPDTPVEVDGPAAKRDRKNPTEQKQPSVSNMVKNIAQAATEDDAARLLKEWTDAKIRQKPDLLFECLVRGSSRDGEIVVTEYGADVNTVDKNGAPILVSAARLGMVDFCSMLLAHKADVNKVDQNGETPLHWAAWQDHQNVCALLIQHEAAVNAQNLRGETPLHQAAWKGHQNVCALLIERKAAVNAQNLRGETPLHQAARNGDQNVCALLIERKAAVDAQDLKGETPLMKATLNPKACDAIKVLLDGKADVNKVDQNGETPLHQAALNGHQNVCALLIRHEAMVNAQNLRGETPLHQAARNGDQNVCALLIKHNAAVDAQCFEGKTPLMKATLNPKACDVIKVLLDGKTDVNKVDGMNASALLHAVAVKNEEICKLLLSRGAQCAVGMDVLLSLVKRSVMSGE